MKRSLQGKNGTVHFLPFECCFKWTSFRDDTDKIKHCRHRDKIDEDPGVVLDYLTENLQGLDWKIYNTGPKSRVIKQSQYRNECGRNKLYRWLKLTESLNDQDMISPYKPVFKIIPVYNGCHETQFKQFGFVTVASQTSRELLSLDNLFDFLRVQSLVFQQGLC